MKKTVFPSMQDVLQDFNKVEKDLNDIRLILCCIAYQQDDLTLSVPVTALEEMPPGIKLDIAFDRQHGNYHFRAILPETKNETTEGATT